MVKTVLHRLHNGGVGNYPLSPTALALLTGRGFGWNDDAIAGEAHKLGLPSPEANWLGFPESFAREWAVAIGRGGLTEAQALDLFTRRIQLRNGYTASALVEPDTLPHHLTCVGDCAEDDCCGRYFRDAVVWDDVQPNKCRCDMPTARGLHMNHIRVVRNKELVKKDIEFMKALEADDGSHKAIATEKQVLRDIPQTFDLTTEHDSPEELKQKWPEGLPKDN